MSSDLNSEVWLYATAQEGVDVAYLALGMECVIQALVFFRKGLTLDRSVDLPPC